MKTHLLLLCSLAFTPLLRADGTPADNVKAAAQKLAAAENYSWKTESPAPEGSQRPGMSQSGQITKGGPAALKTAFGDRVSESVIKDGKVAVKQDDGWKSGEELAAAGGNGGGPNMGAFAARMAENFKAPAADAEALAAELKELKKDGDTIVGDLTEEAAQKRLSFGGRGGRGGNGGGGGGAPAPAKDAKGSVKFWVKDGVLVKYEVNVSGKREANGESRETKRTTTTEIKDIGTTKVEIPAEATAKLPAAKPAAK